MNKERSDAVKSPLDRMVMWVIEVYERFWYFHIVKKDMFHKHLSTAYWYRKTGNLESAVNKLIPLRQRFEGCERRYDI